MANKFVVALLLVACFVVALAYDVQPPPEFNDKQTYCYRECYNQCAFPAKFCKWWCGKGCIYPIASESKAVAGPNNKVPVPTETDYANAPAFLKAEAPSKSN